MNVYYTAAIWVGMALLASVVSISEANDAAFLMGLGQAGGGEVRDDPRLRWVIGGSPVDYHNCVVHAELAPGEVDAAIDAVVERFRVYSVPGTWHVGPSSRPADLGDRLRARGFGGGWADVGMAADHDALPEDVAAPTEVAIRRVGGRAGLAAWARERHLGVILDW